MEEVELARIDLEQKERVQKLILDDIRKLSLYGDASGDVHPDKEDYLWMIIGGRTTLVSGELIVVFPVPVSFIRLSLYFQHDN